MGRAREISREPTGVAGFQIGFNDLLENLTRSLIYGVEVLDGGPFCCSLNLKSDNRRSNAKSRPLFGVNLSDCTKKRQINGHWLVMGDYVA